MRERKESTNRSERKDDKELKKRERKGDTLTKSEGRQRGNKNAGKKESLIGDRKGRQ